MPDLARLVSAADWIAGLICITEWLGNRLMTSSILTDIETTLFERAVGFAAAALLSRVFARTAKKESRHEK